MKETVLISGAAGFLGSHLCDVFLAKGYNVIGIDNLSTGRMENIKYILDHPDFTFVNHDITEKFDFDDFEGNSIDYILHFASPASPVDYLKMPIETLKVGSLGTLNLLDLALQYNARILVASTSEIYGDPLVHPQVEEYWGNVNSVGPRGVYDEAKRFLEAATMAYHTHHGLDTRIVRIFNTYGPRMRLDDGRALPTFVNQALNGEDITVYGDGSQTRSFCYVDDLIDGIYKLLLSDYHLPVNLGNTTEVTLKEFAEEVIALTNPDSKIIYTPLPQDDPKQRKPDITKAINILNWTPKVDRSEGLRLTINFFKGVYF